jgi:type I restriction enzyme M protein
MAYRPVFIVIDEYPYVKEELIDFEWHKGMAASQKQKSVRSLHKAAKEQLEKLKILEISTKSENTLGVQLSAFNLLVELNSGHKLPLENIFHASKVFENGGPFKELLSIPTHEVKRDPLLLKSGNLIGFSSKGKMWPLTPKTIFYDWLYVNTLMSKSELKSQITYYNAFTDIEFNPKKSINCQARSAALFVSLTRNGLLKLFLSSPDEFIHQFSLKSTTDKPEQKDLFS